jgi:hypothetical protein
LYHFVFSYRLFQSEFFYRDIESVRTLVNAGVDVNVKCQGTPVLHLALYTIALPGGNEFGRDCFSLILNAPNCDITAKVHRICISLF